MIDFNYSFAPPHILTLCEPSASNKYLSVISKDEICFNRNTRPIKDLFPLAWETRPATIKTALKVLVNNEKAEFKSWHRHKSGVPYLFAEGELADVSFVLSAISGKTGLIVKVEFKNNGSQNADALIKFAHTNGWVVSNKGWIDGINTNILLTNNDGRADRIICYSKGADRYPVYGLNDPDLANIAVPMANEDFASERPAKTMYAEVNLKENETKTIWYILPHEKYFMDKGTVQELKNTDVQKETDDALNKWLGHLAKSTKISIDDEMLMHCYTACLADLFVMREQIGKYYGICPGTDQYRSSSSGEAVIAELTLDTVGYTKEVEKDLQMYLEGQDDDGCWAYSKGWEHEMWMVCFFKANAVMSHYRLTNNKKFLKKYYKRMYASTMFNYKSRQSTKNATKVAQRGLMQRGMGDCGMADNGDFYGVFYPHNCMAVGADGLTLEAAKILGKKKDITLLEKIYNEARADLIKSISENLIQKGDLKVIPSVPNCETSSVFGCLYAFYPCKLVDADNKMIRDTFKYLESFKITDGGLHEGTGWMHDGVWVAMSLNDMARTYLRMGEYETARKYLYPVLNHATPVVTWCEERGSEKNSERKSGDWQHLWTPLAVTQYITEALCFEDDDTMHLMAGIMPEWIGNDKKINVEGYITSLGKTDISLKNRDGYYIFKMKTERKPNKKIILHLPDKEGKVLDYEVSNYDLKGMTIKIK